jgi:hypothetical protein
MGPPCGGAWLVGLRPQRAAFCGSYSTSKSAANPAKVIECPIGGAVHIDFLTGSLLNNTSHAVDENSTLLTNSFKRFLTLARYTR